jgi:uncharacterized protein (DUF305 family)
MNRPTIRVGVVALCMALGGAAFAQESHSGHTMPLAEQPANPSETGYKRAMDVMHESMSKMKYSGNADVDFVRGMIPHHQAAIDMAKIELVHGKDPEIRKLAEDIISAQEKEIDLMEAWLKANAPK